MRAEACLLSIMILAFQPTAAQSQLAGAGGRAIAANAAAKLAIQPSSHVGTSDRRIHYTDLTCDSAWNERCEDSNALDAPAGTQVCNVFYSVTYEGGYDTEIRTTPGSWYENDPESPDRFRRVEIYMRAGGSRNVLDRVGARITLSDVGITVIPASASNSERFAAGCAMPLHG